ncbi:MAG: hypothetical protein NT105_09535 [Verrucomicrobia bacterium]|nr:hypothetical protein [Verrucomicrobiota bacterium]
MNPDPEAQERFEELLKDDSGVVAPPSPAGSEQQKLHLLTALLKKYKALVRPPATAKHDATGYDAKVQRVMQLTDGIRPEPPSRQGILAELTAFLSFDWMRPAVLVPVAASALLVAVLMISIVVERAGQSRHSLLVLNCIPANVVAQQFVLRGGATSQVRSAEVTSAVLGAVSNRFPAGAVTNLYAAADAMLGITADTYPADALRGVAERFVIVIARVPKAESSQLELRLCDTKKKTVILAKKIEASDPDELHEEVIAVAKLMTGKVPASNR